MSGFLLNSEIVKLKNNEVISLPVTSNTILDKSILSLLNFQINMFNFDIVSFAKYSEIKDILLPFKVSV